MIVTTGGRGSTSASATGPRVAAILRSISDSTRCTAKPSSSATKVAMSAPRNSSLGSSASIARARRIRSRTLTPV